MSDSPNCDISKQAPARVTRPGLALKAEPPDHEAGHGTWLGLLECYIPSWPRPRRVQLQSDGARSPLSWPALEIHPPGGAGTPEATFLLLDLPVGVDTEIQAALPADL